ncbi:type II-A CRISPR-associated protein Csn2 [Granulicatella adiacens]|uniref:type II-A CRISPR-associated protein Csn2 n=1 Tax=Granulicatella adiacens TaxID=46124 RepID=UPI001C3CED8E|nr:type II-A CRISPR-associated protein Csn2 [Granulicatella adiacens]
MGKSIRLNLPILDEPIPIEGFTLFIVENREVLSHLVQLIYVYDEGSQLKLYDSELRTIKPSELIVISDLLGFSINSPAVVKAVQSDLLDQLNENIELKNQVDLMLTQIASILGVQCIESELNLTYNELKIEQIISALEVRVDSESNTLFEQLFEVLQIFKYLVKKKLLIFINVASYFSEEELDAIKEFIELNQINVLFIEPRGVYNYPQYTLDEDFIIIKNL